MTRMPQAVTRNARPVTRADPAAQNTGGRTKHRWAIQGELRPVTVIGDLSPPRRARARRSSLRGKSNNKCMYNALGSLALP